MTLRLGWICCRCITTAMIWLSAFPPASDAGRAVVIVSVCTNKRPLAAPPLIGLRGMPALMLPGLMALAAVTSSSR